MKPLQGNRVLDLTCVLTGPYCTALLADLGGEIVKLEPPAGDDYHHIGLFRDGESVLFTMSNRGKRSVALNLKYLHGLEAALALADKYDVVVENFRRAAIAKFKASEAADMIADTPLQIYGGYGYARDFPIERITRDLRIMRIYEGSSEIQQNIIAGDLLA